MENASKSYYLSGISVISAADSHPNRHEGPKRTTALHHRLPNSAHQLSTPHANPETGESPKHGTCSHSYSKAHHEAHLDSVKAAGLSLLSVRSYTHRHLVQIAILEALLVSFCDNLAQCLR